MTSPPKEAELAELTERSADPNLWDDPAGAQSTMRRAEELRSEIETWRGLGDRARGLAEMAEMAAAEADEGETLAPDLERDLAAIQADWARMEQQLLLAEPFDERGAIVTVHAGAGGTEAQDWAEMLLRMYLRWAERHGFKTEILEPAAGDEAGIKSRERPHRRRLRLRAAARGAGVHRLVRISPFDSRSGATHLRARRGAAGGRRTTRPGRDRQRRPARRHVPRAAAPVAST